jgi:hypothetical protein
MLLLDVLLLIAIVSASLGRLEGVALGAAGVIAYLWLMP